MSEQQTNPGRSTQSLVGDVLSHVSTLLRKEVDLARSEVGQNAERAVMAVGLIVAAVVIALSALNVLAAALVAAITQLGLPEAVSALIVGGGFALIAAALMGKGVNDLKLTSLAPTRTVKSLRRDADVAKDTTNGK